MTAIDDDIDSKITEPQRAANCHCDQTNRQKCNQRCWLSDIALWRNTFFHCLMGSWLLDNCKSGALCTLRPNCRSLLLVVYWSAILTTASALSIASSTLRSDTLDASIIPPSCRDPRSSALHWILFISQSCHVLHSDLLFFYSDIPHPCLFTTGALPNDLTKFPRP